MKAQADQFSFAVQRCPECGRVDPDNEGTRYCRSTPACVRQYRGRIVPTTMERIEVVPKAERDRLRRELLEAREALTQIANAQKVEDADPLEWAIWAHETARTALLAEEAK